MFPTQKVENKKFNVQHSIVYDLFSILSDSSSCRGSMSFHGIQDFGCNNTMMIIQTHLLLGDRNHEILTALSSWSAGWTSTESSFHWRATTMSPSLNSRLEIFRIVRNNHENISYFESLNCFTTLNFFRLFCSLFMLMICLYSQNMFIGSLSSSFFWSESTVSQSMPFPGGMEDHDITSDIFWDTPKS